MQPDDDETLVNDIFGDDRDRAGESAPAGEDPVIEQQAEQPEPEPEAQAAPEPSPTEEPEQEPRHVPLPELLKERDRRKELEAQLAANQERFNQYVQQLQSQQQPQQQQFQPEAEIDPDLDPFGAAQALIKHEREQIRQELGRIEQGRLNDRLNMSERFARTQHGDEIVNEAIAAAERAGLTSQFVNRNDAYGDLVSWHQRERTIAEVGTDPAAFRTQLEQQIRAQVMEELKKNGMPSAQPAQEQQFPGTLADATATGNQGSAPVSDGALINEIFADDRNRRA